MGWFFGFVDGVFPVFFVLVFSLVIAGFIFAIVRGIRTWNKNNASPRLTVDATVVAKRTEVFHHHGNNVNTAHYSSTSYYATFQVASGDRIEFAVDASVYGMIVEGDSGKLSFQGTRFLGFEREY